MKRKKFIHIQQKAKPSRHLQRGTFARLKTSFTNIWKKSGLGHISKIYPQFVNTINSRVNRVTHLAPNKVFKKHEPILISLAVNTTKYKPKYEKGDLFRIAKHDKKFRKGYKQNYTDEVFTIFKTATVSPPTHNLIDANNVKIEGKFYEPELVQVTVLVTADE